MTRKASPVIQEELYSTAEEAAPEGIDDARLLDLEMEKESPFLRAQKRVPARRSALPQKTRARVLWALAAIAIAAITAAAWAALYHYGEHSWRFRLESSDDIEMSGLKNVTRAQVMEVMGGDIGRNVFFIPLDQRQKQLEQIPWVESASVMRFAPNRIQLQIHERTPVAFARVGSKIMLVDSGGALMELSTKKRYSFPVIVGMSLTEPLSAREARMRIYNQLIRELDSGGARYSEDISEVDLSDPEDVKVLTNDAEGEVLVHLGSANYLERFKIYVAHLREWRQQFHKLESVDLRFDRQIIVNPDLRGTEYLPPLSAAAARRAISAGVRPAALVSHEPGLAHSLKPAAVRHAEKASAAAARKPRHAASHPRRHPVEQPAQPSATVRTSGSPAPGAEKPSPVVLKGAGSR